MDGTGGVLGVSNCERLKGHLRFIRNTHQSVSPIVAELLASLDVRSSAPVHGSEA